MSEFRQWLMTTAERTSDPAGELIERVRRASPKDLDSQEDLRRFGDGAAVIETSSRWQAHLRELARRDMHGGDHDINHQ